jgi:hypothetical protein
MNSSKHYEHFPEISEERRIKQEIKRKYPFIPYHALTSGNTPKNIETLKENNVPVEDVLPYSLGINSERFRKNLETCLSYEIPPNKITHRMLKFTSQEGLEIYISKSFPEYSKMKCGWALEEEEVRNLLDDGRSIYEIKSNSYVGPLIETRIAKTAIGQMRKKRIGKKQIIEELIDFGFSEVVLDSIFGKEFLTKILKEQKIKNPKKITEDLDEAIVKKELYEIPLELSKHRVPFKKSALIVKRLQEAL